MAELARIPTGSLIVIDYATILQQRLIEARGRKLLIIGGNSRYFVGGSSGEGFAFLAQL